MSSENKDLKILLDNISELGARKDLIDRQLDISFELLAKRIAEDTKNINSPLQSISDYRKLLEKYCKDASPERCIGFIKELTSAMSFPLSFLSMIDEPFELFSKSSAAKISYVKNNYNDMAYMLFSKLFLNPKVSYAASFEEVCEDVYNGISDYCILPLESVSNGKMFGFYSLIEKYELKVFAVCDVEEEHSEERTRYALLSKSNLLFLDSFRKNYFEFSVIGDNEYNALSISRAAQGCGMKLYRVDSLPVKYDNSIFRFYYVFEYDSSSVIPFLIYLNFKYPQCKSIGHYVLI